MTTIRSSRARGEGRRRPGGREDVLAVYGKSSRSPAPSLTRRKTRSTRTRLSRIDTSASAARSRRRPGIATLRSDDAPRKATTRAGRRCDDHDAPHQAAESWYHSRRMAYQSGAASRPGPRTLDVRFRVGQPHRLRSAGGFTSRPRSAARGRGEIDPALLAGLKRSREIASRRETYGDVGWTERGRDRQEDQLMARSQSRRPARSTLGREDHRDSPSRWMP